MILAAIDSTGYNFVKLIHILAVVVAFAPVVLIPLLQNKVKEAGGDSAVQATAKFMHFYTAKVSMAGLVVSLLTGFALIGMSGIEGTDKSLFEFSQLWVSLAFLVWFILAGVISGMIGKGERLKSEGDMSGMAIVAKGGTIATVFLVIMVYLMVFTPGL